MQIYSASIFPGTTRCRTVTASSNKQLLKLIQQELDMLVAPIRYRQYMIAFMIFNVITYISLVGLFGRAYGIADALAFSLMVGFGTLGAGFLFKKGAGTSMHSKLSMLPLLIAKRREWRKEFLRHSSPDSRLDSRSSP
ncbi:MAG: hypothetical protein EOP04_27560 [Proteobacteria bacterium]|nr:MAG: hypothetical protein EOP04_27560 [Pseudomonadota bacterium]